MTTTNKYYMADFSASDPRSTAAHLAGTSVRARAYVAFAAVASIFGLSHVAPDAYHFISLFFFKRRKQFKRVGLALVHVLTSAIGLVGGIYLSYCF